jgi:hypothetical protein
MKRTACALLVWACLRAQIARADPQATCAGERAGDRAQVRIRLDRLFDDELLHLVRLGLSGHIHLEVSLYRFRPFWFDERRATETRDLIVTWSRPQDRFTLDGNPLASLTALEVPAFSIRRLASGDHYLEITARLEVVTVQSLGQMATWLVKGHDEEPSRLGRGLVSYVAAGLVRTASARCAVD